MSGKNYIVEEIKNVFDVDSIRAEKLLDGALSDHEVICSILECIDDSMDIFKLAKRLGVKPYHLL